MTGAVQEGAAETGGGDDVAGDRVEGLGGHARRDGGHGGALRLPQHRVVVHELGRGGTAGDVRAGAVGAVARRHGAADVDHDRLAHADRAVRGAVVRARAVRAGGHDDEVDGGVPGRPDRGGEVGGDLPLGAAGAQPLPIRRCTASIAAPASASAATSAGDLRIRISRSTSEASRWAAPGSASRSARTCCAHIRSASPTARTGPGSAARTSGHGSVPSAWSTIRYPVPGAASASGRSSTGTISVGSPSAGSTRQVSRSPPGRRSRSGSAGRNPG